MGLHPIFRIAATPSRGAVFYDADGTISMLNSNLAARDHATPAPSPEPGIVSHYVATSRELRPPLALWIYVARGVGRIMLSVLALPFV
ncbi:MAG: hypothetical protein ABI240_00085 [Sphingomonas sp.]